MAKKRTPAKPTSKRHMGRVRPTAVFDSGRFRFTIQANHSVKVTPLFSAHYIKAHDAAPPPTTTDWLAKCVTAIAETYGNTTKGDCVIASILHEFGGWTGNESGTPALSSDTEALATYQTICGPGDNGCVITNVLDYAKATGIPISGTPHKIADYVAIDWTNQNEVQVAIEVFGPAVKLGINLPQAWYDASAANGFVWDVTTSPAIGGHDVPIIDVTPLGVVVASWGFSGTITWPAMASTVIIEEAYCSLAPDWESADNLAPNGIDAATLAADLVLIGNGTVPPLTPTPPAPVVPPVTPPVVPPPVTPPPGSSQMATAFEVLLWLATQGYTPRAAARLVPTILLDAFRGMTAAQIEATM